MSKLALSKKIMDRHNEIPRGTNDAPLKNYSQQVESFEPIQGNYNIPNEFISEEVNTKENNQPITQDRIINSKLPDEINSFGIL